MGKLKKYWSKRNFNKTSEPKGKTKSPRRKELRFVVQEHHARRLHWDFRLELDGVLKSWAVPKGPPLEAGIKRLAVEVEDHPLEYGKFEGVIPEGEYGAGEVFIWDKGVWEPEHDPHLGLRKGELKFRIKGEKLNGSYVLVRTAMKGSSSKSNWLLIRHRDVVLPDFFPPQMPLLGDIRKYDKNEVWGHEIKLDGYRIQIHINQGLVKFFTRNGLDWTHKFPRLAQSMEAIFARSAILDGEIVAFDEEGRSSFFELQERLKYKSDNGLHFVCFDLLYLEGSDLRGLPLIERVGFLKEILPKHNENISQSEIFLEDASSFYEVACQMKLEGVVSKRLDLPYHSGRGSTWVKTKCLNREEFIILGWKESSQRPNRIRSLALGYFEEGGIRFVGLVGSGLSQSLDRDLKKEFAKLRSGISYNKDPKIHWVEPRLVCEIKFSEWTKEGLLRQPVFLGLREDKFAEEVVGSISSGNRTVFSGDQVTKLDVANYYQRVSARMLPYISGRPLSLVRCPQGTSGHCFFQKHPESGSSSSIDISSVPELLGLVQLNAIEFHIGNSTTDSPDYPNQFVMDFDPGPDVGWKDVVKAAFEYREILKSLGLRSFVKLTGGKGIHVHVPIRAVYSSELVKSFAQSLAVEMEERSPNKYVTNMSKKLRKGKIFLDYLRNGPGATAVAPYSLRVNEKSAVAVPVSWEELSKIKGSHQFGMEKTLARLERNFHDPWKDYFAIDQPIMVLDEFNTLSA